MDWNGNGKKDSFDSFMDYKLSTGGDEEQGNTGCCLFSLALMILPAAGILAGIVGIVCTVIN